MTQPTLLERAHIIQLAAARARRRSAGIALASPLMRWRRGPQSSRAPAVVPQELRPADPTFAEEVARGHFGLPGGLAKVARGRSPFEAMPPSEAWAQALHGFAWLRHLNAAATEAAAEQARSLVTTWIDAGEGRSRTALEPHVEGRRLISWLSNASLLLDGTDAALFDRITQNLADQSVRLSSTWRGAADGYPRLEALMGRVYADACIGGNDRHLRASERLLAAEIARQVLPDGGHVSRNSSVILELMLDLLPLRQCFIAQQCKFPPSIDEAMARMMVMLRTMRLGDGSLGRFNGVGNPAIAELATVLAYDTAGIAPHTTATHSRYVRLEREAAEEAGLVLLADIGTAPPLEVAGRAQAGALSFEVSSGTSALFVNGGLPWSLEDPNAWAARATASHNTLCLGDKSSARLLRDARIEHIAGGAVVRSLGVVPFEVGDDANGQTLTAENDGYLASHGLRHTRKLTLAADGRSLSGLDRLGGPRTSVRLVQDVPYAIRFHMHPHVRCDLDADGAAELVPREGSRWRFSAEGAEMSLEPSLHYADPAGTVRTQQIVLRGACWGETEVSWRLERTI